jgi:hypothetical protein
MQRRHSRSRHTEREITERHLFQNATSLAVADRIPWSTAALVWVRIPATYKYKDVKAALRALTRTASK